MATLKSQIENINWNGLERQSEQECNILDRKIAPNGCGAEFILVEFISNGHPFDTQGITVIVIDEGYADMDSSYVKTIFNK
jgi:hypothetical protein